MNSTDKTSTTRLGLVLFSVYLVFYVAFVLISALASDTFEMQVFAGLNLAVVYGFFLIVLAFVLAIIYGALSKRA